MKTTVESLWLLLGALITASNLGLLDNFPLNGRFLFGFPAYLTGYYFTGILPVAFGVLLVAARFHTVAAYIAQRVQIVLFAYLVVAFASSVYSCAVGDCAVDRAGNEWINLGWLKIVTFGGLLTLVIMSDREPRTCFRAEVVVLASIGAWASSFPVYLEHTTSMLGQPKEIVEVHTQVSLTSPLKSTAIQN